MWLRWRGFRDRHHLRTVHPHYVSKLRQAALKQELVLQFQLTAVALLSWLGLSIENPETAKHLYNFDESGNWVPFCV